MHHSCNRETKVRLHFEPRCGQQTRHLLALEAHKSHNITFSITGLDVAYDNPVFAAIELDYSEADNDSTGAAINQATKVR